MDFDAGPVRKYLGQGGKMAQLPGFRYRKEQEHLAEAVANALGNDLFLVAEVGTGVGKTFGYLLPAILFAVREKQKVVVSTRTRALQEQILEHDYLDLKQIMDCDFNLAEARGRENYLCWTKYTAILNGRKNLEDKAVEFIQAILTWAERTTTGDRKELALNHELMQHWGLVAADRNSCQRERCRYRDKCFRLKMLKSLEKADIIIVNHALLLSDLLTEHSILPNYEYLIIDEAHTFNREAFDHLANRFISYNNLNAYRILYDSARGGRGYLYYLKNRYPELVSLLDEIAGLVKRAGELNQELFASISRAGHYGGNYNYTRVITGDEIDQEWLDQTVPVYLDWQFNQNRLIDKLEGVTEELADADEVPELKSVIATLLECGDSGYKVMEEDLNSSERMVWIEYSRGSAAAICSSPISSNSTVDLMLYQKLRAMIMVSATITIEDHFDHFINQNGLQAYQNEERMETLLEKSPFNYREQSRLYIVEDLPEPTSPNFDQAVIKVLDDVISAVGGNILVLFTSRQQLQTMSAALKPVCRQKHICLLAQYEDGDFGTLIDTFTASTNTVLMGLETFWEGVDLKGDLLRCLVIVKLPFRSPTDPYCSAWERHYKLQRQNGFVNFMLPDAVMRFKQGVGRLIRSEEDRGAVVVLDPRLSSKRYGQVFLNSIPIKNIISLNARNIGTCLQDWL